MFDRLRLFFAKGTQGVCVGVEEIGVDFQQWDVAGSQALLFLVLVFRLTCSGHSTWCKSFTCLTRLWFVNNSVIRAPFSPHLKKRVQFVFVQYPPPPPPSW